MVEVSRLRLKTIYHEKSAEVIVGSLKLKKKVAEGLNNVTVQTNVCTCGYLTADVGETYMSRKRENIGVTTGSGKERSTQSMSELLEKILDNRNMNEAYKKVCANKGAGGVDGMELEELDGYIRENWNSIREQIRNRSYKPQPVRRVEIPKPNGSKRKLGIPTVFSYCTPPNDVLECCLQFS